MQVEGVDDGASRLIVIVIDGYSSETTSNVTLFENVHLHLGAKVLPQEMGRGAASNPRADHRWMTNGQRATVKKCVQG